MRHFRMSDNVEDVTDQLVPARELLAVAVTPVASAIARRHSRFVEVFPNPEDLDFSVAAVRITSPSQFMALEIAADAIEQSMTAVHA